MIRTIPGGAASRSGARRAIGGPSRLTDAWGSGRASRARGMAALLRATEPRASAKRRRGIDSSANARTRSSEIVDSPVVRGMCRHLQRGGSAALARQPTRRVAFAELRDVDRRPAVTPRRDAVPQRAELRRGRVAQPADEPRLHRPGATGRVAGRARDIGQFEVVTTATGPLRLAPLYGRSPLGARIGPRQSPLFRNRWSGGGSLWKHSGARSEADRRNMFYCADLRRCRSGAGSEDVRAPSPAGPSMRGERAKSQWWLPPRLHRHRAIDDRTERWLRGRVARAGHIDHGPRCMDGQGFSLALHRPL